MPAHRSLRPCSQAERHARRSDPTKKAQEVHAALLLVASAYSMRAPREKPFLPGLNHPSKQLRPRFHPVTTPPRQAHVEARPSRSASETGLFARSVTPQASAGGPPEAECGGHVSLLPARSPAVSSQPLCTPPTSPDSSSASRRGLRGHSG